MPRTNAREEIRVEKAVGFLQRCPNLMVPEAMKLADFAPQEIACKAWRMWIYQQWNKLTQRNLVPSLNYTTINKRPRWRGRNRPGDRVAATF